MVKNASKIQHSSRRPLYLPLSLLTFVFISDVNFVKSFSGHIHRTNASPLSQVSYKGSFTVERPSSLRSINRYSWKGNLDWNTRSSDPLAVSCIKSLVHNNKKTMMGLGVAALTIGIPSAAHAVPALNDMISVTGGNTALTAFTSSSALLEKLSSTGFYQAFSLVFLSEIGDKTFFIAGLLAMKTSRFVSFVGSIAALAVMTIISCVLGQIFHAIPSGIAQGIPLDDVAAVLAFTYFGFKILKEAYELDPEGASVMDEELAEAEETVEGSKTIKEVTAWGQILSTFGLVFAAEFGDRSFLSTIALSAAQNPISVGAGAIAAHGVATGIAVIGGGVIAKYLSEKVIGYIGGSLFLVFAVTTAFGLF